MYSIINYERVLQTHDLSFTLVTHFYITQLWVLTFCILKIYALDLRYLLEKNQWILFFKCKHGKCIIFFLSSC